MHSTPLQVLMGRASHHELWMRGDGQLRSVPFTASVDASGGWGLLRYRVGALQARTRSDMFLTLDHNVLLQCSTDDCPQ